VLWKIGTFTAGAGEPLRFLFPLENFSAQTKSFGAGCRIEPGANAGGGRRAFVSMLLNARMWL
jgi:hypothetical protein